jgi:hypothetical protein
MAQQGVGQFATGATQAQHATVYRKQAEDEERARQASIANDRARGLRPQDSVAVPTMHQGGRVRKSGKANLQAGETVVGKKTRRVDKDGIQNVQAGDVVIPTPNRFSSTPPAPRHPLGRGIPRSLAAELGVN